MRINTVNNRYFLFFIALMLIISIPPGSIVAESQHNNVATLQQLIRQTLKNNPMLKISRYEQKKAAAGLRYAKGLRYLTKLELTVAGGIVPEDDNTYIEGLGPFVKNELKVVQPVYTFGKLDAARDAAALGLKAVQAKGLVVKDNVTFQVIRAWWAVVATRKAHSTIDEMIGKYSKLENDVGKEAKKIKSNVDDNDVLELKTKKFELIKMQQQAAARKITAAEALRLLTGINDRQYVKNNQIQMADIHDPVMVLSGSNLSQLVTYAVQNRNEIAGLNLAVKAKQALVRLADRRKYPDLFIAAGARLNWAHTENYDDSFNSKGAAAFVGLKWDLDFWRKNSKKDQAVQDRRIMEQKLQGLLMKLRLEVVQAVQDCRAAERIYKQAKKSFKASKTWLRLAGDNWEMGLGKIDEVIKAYRTYYEMKGAVIKARYDYHLKIAGLAKALGNTNLYLRWVQNEKVSNP